ncbi:MAG: hypothetical protein R3199_11460 [Gemmatimonadota bacterium]|nr:hypothetical protein [Gemmatimonadota bacterium]
MIDARSEVCPPGEIRGWSAIVLWGIPAALIVAGGVWSELYLWLATPAFAVMGIACVANAARCGRLHCYATGPLLLAMAAYHVAVALELAPAAWLDEAGIVLLAGIVLAFAAERIADRRYVGG